MKTFPFIAADYQEPVSSTLPKKKRNNTIRKLQLTIIFPACCRRNQTCLLSTSTFIIYCQTSSKYQTTKNGYFSFTPFRKEIPPPLFVTLPYTILKSLFQNININRFCTPLERLAVCHPTNYLNNLQFFSRTFFLLARFF